MEKIVCRYVGGRYDKCAVSGRVCIIGEYKDCFVRYSTTVMLQEDYLKLMMPELLKSVEADDKIVVKKIF